MKPFDIVSIIQGFSKLEMKTLYPVTVTNLKIWNSFCDISVIYGRCLFWYLQVMSYSKCSFQIEFSFLNWLWPFISINVLINMIKKVIWNQNWSRKGSSNYLISSLCLDYSYHSTLNLTHLNLNSNDGSWINQWVSGEQLYYGNIQITKLLEKQ